MWQMKRVERNFHEHLTRIPFSLPLMFPHICISLCNAEHIKESSWGWVQKVPSNFHFLFLSLPYFLNPSSSHLFEILHCFPFPRENVAECIVGQ